ncbi:phage tail protein [Nannocystis punicea]|uniref:Phage tail protein n=1 Tax=Nannocystis punicea TaxID=2995304 RepID=A0ABY7H993_9BACT|nr:phage tail protein [Nannocystis poenicansa]WAS95660.1 phage tail protein [Nannocystis poenicansa]
MHFAGERPLGFGSTPFGEVPVGALVAFAGALAPTDGDHVTRPLEGWGWMLCDGRSLSVAQYPELFSVLGYVYGGSAGSFRIPDYRGYFLRGVDAGAGVDRDAATRTDPAGGAARNSGVGSIQPFATQTHEHTYLAARTTAAPANSGSAAGAPVGESQLTSGGPVTGNAAPSPVHVSQYETRPSNIYVNYIIKFTSGLRARPW